MASLTFEGGLNEQDLSLVHPSECISGYNFELGANNTHLVPRKPFDLKDTSTNAGDIRGFIQLIKNDDTETTLVQSGDTVYTWDGTTFTSKGTVNGSSKLRGLIGGPWVLDGYQVITDLQKLTVVKKWDGTTFGNLTTGLGTNLYAKYGIVHLGRVWLFNVTTGSNTPHLLVASVFENPESYDTSKRAQDASFSAGTEAFFMTTPDGKPINGVTLFYNQLVMSTEGGRLWKLTGSDSTDFAWVDFYAGSAAIGDETVANIGNDVVYMKRDGVIESLVSTEQFGDVKGDDLSRWIRATTTGLAGCITVYDQTRQKVYFFAGSNKLLVLFKDMLSSQLSPWSLYKTNHTSSFSTNAAVYMREPGGTNYYVYFGDSSGNIYQLDGTGTGDPSTTAIETNRKLKFFEQIETKSGTLDPRFRTVRGRVFYRRIADADLLMEFEWADDYSTASCTVPLDGPDTGDAGWYWGGSMYWGGEFYWNEGFQVTQRVSTKGFSPVGRGPGFNLSLTIQDTQKFDIQKIEI